MDDKQAIAAAKAFVREVYRDEGVDTFRLEEFEHMSSAGRAVTLSFARPWETPRTRAQEVLESLGASSPVQRIFKVVTIADDGSILSVKDRAYPLAAE